MSSMDGLMPVGFVWWFLGLLVAWLAILLLFWGASELLLIGSRRIGRRRDSGQQEPHGHGTNEQLQEVMAERRIPEAAIRQ